MSHTVKMLLGCLIPLLLIFLLPVLGVSGDTTSLVFLVLMFACHLFMMRGHDHGHRHDAAGSGKEGHHDAAQS